MSNEPIPTTVAEAEAQILAIVAELYDSEHSDRYGAITDRLIAAEDVRRAAVVYAEAVVAKAVAYAEATAVKVFPPASDDPEAQWEVIGDLRVIVDLDGTGYSESTNYAVRDQMVVEGWPAKNLDPEYSAFFGYADTEQHANRLRDDAIRIAKQMKADRS